MLPKSTGVGEPAVLSIVASLNKGSTILPLARSSRGHHNVSVATTKPRVLFEPMPMKIGSGWYVLVTFPSGVSHRLGGFKTEEEARIWIACKSAAWLKEYDAGKYA